MNLKKLTKQLLIVVSVVLVMTSCSNKNREIMIAGSGWNKIVRYDLDDQRIVWSHQLERGQECNEVSLTPNGDVLYSYRRGAKIVGKDHRTLWNYDAPDGTELQSASITIDGNILLGQCGSPAEIFEYDRAGHLLKKITFDTGVKNPHGQLRRVRKTERGTYLVPIFGRGEVWELNDSGDVLKKVKVGGVPFSAIEMAEDHWMVSCGDGHYLLEINPLTNEVIRKIERDDIHNIPLRFVAESVRLSSGNTLICNWGGHERGKKRVSSLMEITPEKEVVWSIELSDSLGMVSSVFPVWDEDCMR
ncbi:hypothetical protein K4L44_09185 [Halosquirtibacter laminarini]|uniref:Uncharacterized protein n=1 Tax=Halosquirtibacter laminarini TaxID=3374600 RepID=A0AC61NBC1_9BACT|nr:hypothetical protein K4L44_09185 [Prolixibacteraceae bacterium]